MRHTISHSLKSRILGLCLLFLCFATQAWGLEFVHNNIYYITLTNNTVAVKDRTNYSSGDYTRTYYEGNVVVPATFTYNGVSYTVREIDRWAFADCNNLVSVTLPNTITAIRGYAFAYSRNLVSVNIPGTVTTIAEEAFAACENLASITLPSGLTSIGNSAFYYCRSLTSITIPNSVTSIGNAVFRYCENLASVTLSNGLTTIPAGAFIGCTNIPSITIPNSVTTIEENAFQVCNLRSIIIPGSVTSIGGGAFTNIAPPDYIEVLRPTPCQANGAFVDFGGCILIVPQGARAAYQAHADWAFEMIVEKGDISASALPAFGHNETAGKTVTVAADRSWSVTSKPSWVTLNPSAVSGGMGKKSFTVTVAPNGSIEQRSGNIVVYNGSVSKNIPVTQLGVPSISISEASVSFGANEIGNKSIPITSNIGWTASKSPNDASSAWLTISTTSGAANQALIITTNSANTSITQRQVTITVSGTGAASKTIVVTQAAPPTLTVSAPSSKALSFGATGTNSPQTITIASNTGWTVSKDSAWITHSISSGSGNLSFTANVVTANPTITARSGKIIVTSGNLREEIIVTQAAGAATLAVSAPGSKTLSFGATGTNSPQTINIASNTGWTVSKDSAWITHSISSGSGNMSFTANVVVANSTITARSGKIIVTSGNLREEITVTQATDLTFDVPTEPLTFEYDDATVKRIDVTAYTSWTATKDSAWITLDPESPSGNEPGSFTVAVAENPGAERTDTITVTNGATIKKIPVTQATTPALNVPTTPLTFAHDDATPQLIDVTAYTAWTVAKDSAWITLDPESPFGNEPGSFTIAVAENPGVERTDTITVTNGTTIKKIPVTQAANPTFNVPTEPLIFAYNYATALRINVTAYTAWTAATDSAWIILNPANPADNKPGSFTVAVRKNPGVERKGKVTVTNGTKTDTIYVIQTNNSLSFEVAGIHYYTPAATGSSELEVVAPATDAYTGKVIIPSTAYYSGKTYQVTTIGAEAFAGSDVSYLGLPFSLKSVGTDAFKGCVSLDSVEIKWTSSAAAYPEGIQHAFGGVEVSEVTLMVPEGTKAIYQIARFWGLFRIEEGQTPVGTAKAAEAVTVSAASGRLYIDSPAAETIYVYSFTGKLLHTATKASGKAVFDLPAEKLLIVRGSSGWARKLVN
jgi:lipopolysaccharide export system protein LptA